MAEETASKASHLQRHQHHSKEEAKAAANAKKGELDRSTRTLSMTIMGKTAVAAEKTIVVKGVRSRIDDTWRVKTATHTITPSGYQTKIEAEKPGAKSGGSSGSGVSS